MNLKKKIKTKTNPFLLLCLYLDVDASRRGAAVEEPGGNL